jgi:hypothetical protein
MLRKLTKPWMSEREYRANSEGLNIVFGATLGFVLAGAEKLNTLHFITVLVLTVSIVVSILYISASARRFAYGFYALLGIFAMPFIVEPLFSGAVELPGKLQPTLMVWAIVALVIEFTPREKSGPSSETEIA